MGKKYEIVEVDQVEIVADVSLLSKSKEILLNVTQMAIGYGKLPADYLRLDSTVRYIDALISHYGISHSELVKITIGGRYSGTWFHRLLIIDFARWLSATFAVKLDAWIIERLEQERVWQQSRLAAKTGYLPMSEAVEDDHDPIKFYHYSNEANMINKVIFGLTSKQFKEQYDVEDVRDACTAAQLCDLEDLQAVNTTLIKLGIDYSDRKQSIINYYTKNRIE